MTIVSTAIESDTGIPRVIKYLCTDHLGGTHKYGPVIANPNFDAEAHKVVVAAKVEAALAEAEAQHLLGDN